MYSDENFMNFKPNCKNKWEGLDFLARQSENAYRVMFFDPQYRGVLDKLKYGNEGKSRGKERANLPQMSEDTIGRFIDMAYHCIAPNGYIFLWLDKFHLCQGVDHWWDAPLKIVDLITWDKCRMGMGYRSRRQSEYLLVLQKEPAKAKETWHVYDIPDVWQEKISVKNHPHTKPINLIKKLIMATTENSDYVIDPAAGGYNVLYAAVECNRNFLGCDILG